MQAKELRNLQQLRKKYGIPPNKQHVLQPAQARYQPWTEVDEEYIAIHYTTMAPSEMAKQLGRSTIAVRSRMKRLNLRK